MLFTPEEEKRMAEDRKRDDAAVLKAELEARIAGPGARRLPDLEERPLFGGPRQSEMFGGK